MPYTIGRMVMEQRDWKPVLVSLLVVVVISGGCCWVVAKAFNALGF